MNASELTRSEKTAIRKLVTTTCANYDWEYACLLLENPCYMMGKCWTGSYCKYFRTAILPLDPALEAALLCHGAETRLCALCESPFHISGNQKYCSENCAVEARRVRQRKYLCRKRG